MFLLKFQLAKVRQCSVASLFYKMYFRINIPENVILSTLRLICIPAESFASEHI